MFFSPKMRFARTLHISTATCATIKQRGTTLVTGTANYLVVFLTPRQPAAGNSSWSARSILPDTRSLLLVPAVHPQTCDEADGVQ